MWVIGPLGEAQSRSPGLRAMVGGCGLLVAEWGGRGRSGGRVGGCGAGFACVVSVYVSAYSGAPVWSLLGEEVWRRSLPSSAAAARIPLSVCIWCTSLSLVGRGYCRGGLRSMRQRTLRMAWYPQVRECCGLGGPSFRVSGPASTCVWAMGMAQIQGTVPMDGQRRLIHWDRQGMPSPRWSPARPEVIWARARAGAWSPGWRTPLKTLCRVVGSLIAPVGATPGASMVLVPLMTQCGPGDVAVAATT